MVNRLSIERRTQIIGALVEGNSIRSVERMTNTHRDTIMRLGFEVGKGCHRLMFEKMRGLNCQRIECDEIWSYVRKKQNQLKPGESVRAGDFWTFVAIDPETKLVPCYLTGKRTLENATMFMRDLARRVDNRPQISTDGLPSYIRAVEDAWGSRVDYGQVVKFYDAEPTGPGRYAPPKVSRVEKEAVWGNPDMATLSTSIVERQNHNMRMSMRRFTRLTNGFSKKLDNLKGAVALHFAHYNFVRQHRSLRVSPAMAAGVESKLWTLQELVEETSR
jgi:IS1 family transposase